MSWAVRMRGANRAAFMRTGRGAGSLARMRRLIWPGVLACTCLLAACGAGGSSGSSPASSLTARPAASGGTAPTASAAAPGAVACLPVDTPVDKAPAAIASVWRDRDVMIVPACSVFDVKLPAFVNLARSAGLSDAEAKRIAEARIRSEQMVNWGLRSGQLSIADSLSPVSLYTTPALDAVHAGYSVTSVPDAPGCSIPSKITVLPIPTQTATGMDRSDPGTSPGPYGVVAQYGPGDCTLVGTKSSQSETLVHSGPTPAEFVVGGLVRHDSPAGVDYWYYVVGGTCGQSPVLSTLCRSAGY
jgi:hypothetical protein